MNGSDRRRHRPARGPQARAPLALEAVDGYLRETGYALDFFGRLELLDLTLDELEAEVRTDLTEPKPN